MKLSFYFILIGLFLASCNPVAFRVKSTTRKLAKVEVTPHFFENDSLTLKFWKGGNGPALIFIHGFGGDALLSWEKQLSFFAKDHTVIAPDLLWFGESSSTKPPNLSSQTDAIIDLMDYLQVEKATIIGQSYGGFVAINLVQKAPSRIQKLVLANCPGTTFNVSELDKVCQKYAVQTIDEFFVLKEPQQIQRLFDLVTYTNPQLPKILLKSVFSSYFGKNNAELTQLLRLLEKDQDKFPNFSTGNISTLVVWGEQDELFSLAEGKLFSDTIGAEFKVISNCGHAPQVDQPAEFLKIMQHFILEK
jgi:pimeloyl-ACP methyl ester carboxylesterase